MDEKTEKINVIADEDVAVAEESGPAEARKPRRRAACAGGAAALAAVAVAVALMMQPAEAVEVEGFAARALIPHIPIESPWAAGGAAVPADEALADTGEAEASEGTAEEPVPADGASAAEAGQPEQGAASPSASGSSSAAAPAQGSASSGSASQPQQQAPAASQPQAPAHEHSWQPVTENRWVVDKAAWDEKKQTGTVVQAECGKTFKSVEAWDGHLSRGHDCAYSVVPKYEIVHHDEVGHNESVTTGYKCSCGATK
ncbi:MAG: hypothetical protein HFJ74_09360 [Eggerthellaceae bacterium]|nr:hypothetical protein [Eggerthellaceae bacterium]